MRTFTKVKETWLSQKPKSNSLVVSAFFTFLLALGSSLAWRNFAGAESWMPASRDLVFNQQEYWRLWTTLFVHGDGKHLLANSFFFFILSFFLWGYFGFWVFPSAAFLMGGLTNLVVLSRMPPDSQLIGVSGVVFWMGSAWLTLYLLLDLKRSLKQRIIRSIGVALALFMPAEAFDPTISYRAHFYGFVFGIAWALLYWLFNRATFNQALVKETIYEEDSSEPADIL